MSETLIAGWASSVIKDKKLPTNLVNVKVLQSFQQTCSPENFNMHKKTKQKTGYKYTSPSLSLFSHQTVFSLWINSNRMTYCFGISWEMKLQRKATRTFLSSFTYSGIEQSRLFFFHKNLLKSKPFSDGDLIKDFLVDSAMLICHEEEENEHE